MKLKTLPSVEAVFAGDLVVGPAPTHTMHIYLPIYLFFQFVNFFMCVLVYLFWDEHPSTNDFYVHKGIHRNRSVNEALPHQGLIPRHISHIVSY